MLELLFLLVHRTMNAIAPTPSRMAKAKPAKTVKKIHKTAKPTKSTAAKPQKSLSSSTKIGILLFAFLLVMTIGAMMYQSTSEKTLNGKNVQASTFKEYVSDFTDISQQDRINKDFMFAIQYLTTKGIVLGYGDNKLKPDNPVNRAEFLKMLAIALRANVAGFDKPCFKDVLATDWFAPYVCFAKDAGWVAGYGDGKILPGNQISIAEALKIIVTAEQWDTTNVKDLPYPKSWKVVEKAWYMPYVKVAYSKFLLYNYRFAENLDPASLLSRKDVIVILFSGILVDTIKVDKYDPKYIQQLFKQENIPYAAGDMPQPAAATGEPTPVSPEPQPKK